MRITSKISHYHKGFLALILAPFLWLQMYFHALEEWLTDIIYTQLFKPKTTYSEITHVLAYCCFSVFSMLAYYKQLSQYISLILYSLWLINYFSAKFRIGLYVDKPVLVRVERKEQSWQWSLLLKNQLQNQQSFPYAEINCVLIAATTYGDDSFRNQVLQVWHVHLQTKDEQNWVVYQAATIQQALNQAVSLAAEFNTKVKIAESYGSGELADIDLGAHNRPVFAWQRDINRSTIKIYKNFSTLSFFGWTQAIFAELGDFIFIAVLASVMQWYGKLLLMLFGNSLGLRLPPTETLELSISAIFSPDFDWTLLTVFAITLGVLLHSIYKQSRKHEIIITNKRVQYRISGENKSYLTFNESLEVLLLRGFDKTSLIIINEQYKVLEITDLEEEEYDELYQILLTT